MAAQQAGAAASAIARALGADVPPEPFRPVLRGLLLDPAGPKFLDSTRGTTVGEDALARIRSPPQALGRSATMSSGSGAGRIAP